MHDGPRLRELPRERFAWGWGGIVKRGACKEDHSHGATQNLKRTLTPGAMRSDGWLGAAGVGSGAASMDMSRHSSSANSDTPISE